jgi:hypothetical protein
MALGTTDSNSSKIAQMLISSKMALLTDFPMVRQSSAEHLFGQLRQMLVVKH